MSLVRIELEVANYHAGLPDEVVQRMMETDIRTPPVNCMQVQGAIVEQLRCVEALLLGPDTVGITRVWEIVDVVKLDKNWRN